MTSAVHCHLKKGAKDRLIQALEQGSLERLTTGSLQYLKEALVVLRTTNNMNPVLADEELVVNSASYALFAAVCHRGQSGYGHYTAIC